MLPSGDGETGLFIRYLKSSYILHEKMTVSEKTLLIRHTFEKAIQ